MNITRHLLVLAGVGAMASVSALASINPSQTPANPNNFVAEIEQVLSMTPQQKSQAETAIQQARQSAKPIRQQLTNTNKSLQSAVRANNTTEIRQLSKTEGQEIGRLLAIRSSAVANIYKTLTPAQQERADALQRLMAQGFRQEMNHAHSRIGS